VSKAGLSTIRAIAHNGIVVDEFEMLITDPHAVIFNKKSYKMDILISSTNIGKTAI
jgi:hypothetical protein